MQISAMLSPKSRITNMTNGAKSSPFVCLVKLFGHACVLIIMLMVDLVLCNVLVWCITA